MEAILVLAFVLSFLGSGLGKFAFGRHGLVRFRGRAVVVLAVSAVVPLWPGWLFADWMMGS
ncbi:hypothetical protein OG349_06795 [Streptomyces sp. NBC_01317]|uniref:hypothetical protein n=1 Tax=Streptomyces sp. NBC_01317 TaxID=2903822 RepID=UPI002E155D94|nr:hypothetical protein OG349_06795 [Streptomyces sp. NBC_01317]